MRIAFIVNEFPALSQTFVLNQITGLIDRGHKVDIYANKPANQSRIHFDVEKYNLSERTCYWHMPDNFFIRVLKHIAPLLVNYHKSHCFLQRLSRYFLGHQQYDIVHCHMGPNAITGMHLQDTGILKSRLITTFYGYDVSSYIKKSGRHVYDQLFKKGDLCIPISEHMKCQLISLGCNEKKIILHRIGVDTKRFSFRPCRLPKDGIVRVISIARLIEKKGIEYGIRAVASIIKRNKKIEYNIIGDGPLKDQLQRLVHELGITSSVKFFGWKEQQEIVGMLNIGDILLAPSVTGKDGDQEGIPVAIMEAMAIGLPVLATKHSGIPELIEDGISGFLVPERDVDALAEKLNYLADYPEIWQGMGRAGRAFVEKHHDIDKLNDMLIGIYNQLIKG